MKEAAVKINFRIFDRKEYNGTNNNLQNIHIKLNIQWLGETPTLVLY
jgi:hypothetical protein